MIEYVMQVHAARGETTAPCGVPTLSPTTGRLPIHRPQPFLDQAQDPAIGHAVLDKLHRPFVAHVVKEASNVTIKHPVHVFPLDAHRQRVQRLMWAASGTEPIRESLEVHLINLVEDGHHGLLYDLASSVAMPNGRCRPSAFGM